MSNAIRPELLLQDRRTFWVIGLLALFFCLITDLPWQLDDYDQAKQAFTSFEMVHEGHWFYQRTPHEHIATKPPLIGWISAALLTITRSWNLAWRLPSIVSAAVLAILLFRYAVAAYGPACGLIALAAFSFNLLAPRLAMLVRTDMPLALAIFLAGVMIWQKLRKGDPWNTRDRFAFFGLLLAGLMIKGPIIYAFLLPGLVIFQLSWRKGERGRAWSGWWPWFASLAIFLLWVGAGIKFVPGFYEQVVLREFAGRFAGEFHRSQPLLFYFPHLLHKFAPWSVFMILLAVISVRSDGLRSRFRTMRPETWWLICWAFSGLIVMSLLPSKRVDRIFPVIPPLCLILAAQIRAASQTERFARKVYAWSAAVTLIAIMFTGGYAFWKVTAGYRNHRDALAKFGREVRSQAAAHHWQYEVVSAPDEGLLLYLEKTRFVDPETTIDRWNTGALNALVAEDDQAALLTKDLKNSVISDFHSDRSQSGESSNYVLITRK